MKLDTSEIMTTEVSFKVTTKGGKEKIVGPITLDVIHPYYEASSSVLDQCTHKSKWNRTKSIVDKCKNMCIFDCLVDVDCYYPSNPQVVIGREVFCEPGFHKIQICGKDNNTSQCVSKC